MKIIETSNRPFHEQKFHYLNEMGIIQGSPEEFKILTGASWINDMKFDGNANIPSIYPSADEMELMRFIEPLYEEYLKIPPRLYIRKGGAIDLNTLHALDEIKRGAIVTEYLGEWQPISKTPSHYRWGPIDGLQYRNFGGMIDDGFPNLGAFYLYGVHGVPLRVVFIALEAIAAHDVLCVNYGMSHSVKLYHHHLEYRLNQMTRFFSDHSLDMISTKIKEHIPKKRSVLEWHQWLDFEGLVAKLQYFYHTPSAVNHLLQNSTLDAKSVFDYFERIDNRLYLLGFHNGANKWEKEILAQMRVIQKHFSRPRL